MTTKKPVLSKRRKLQSRPKGKDAQKEEVLQGTFKVEKKSTRDLTEILSYTVNSDIFDSIKPNVQTVQLHNAKYTTKLSSNPISERETFEILDSKLQG